MKFFNFFKKSKSLSEYTIEYFENKYKIEVFIYPIFKSKKCGYDSHQKIGYQYEILIPLSKHFNCYHIDNMVFNLFPENILENDETLKEVGYVYYDTKKEVKDAVLEYLINKYINKII